MPQGTRTTVLIALSVAVLAWPVFSAVATALAVFLGEGWQLDAWSQEPKRRWLMNWLAGWREAAPWSAGLALLVVLERLLLGFSHVTWAMRGIALPAAGAALATIVWPTPADAAPTLIITGLVLALITRLIDLIIRWLT